MQTLQWFFFESTAALGAALFLALFWLLVYWRRSGNLKPLGVGIGIAILLLVIQAAVTTQHEHAAHILARIERDAEKHSAAALEAALAADFSIPGMTRAEFVTLARERLARLTIRTLYRTNLVIDTGPEEFTAHASYLADASLDNDVISGSSEWLIRFARHNDRWLIVEIEPVRIQNVPLHGWQDLRR